MVPVSAPPSLPARTREIYAFIVHRQAAEGAPPTLREIGRRFGIRSTNGVHYHLQLLARAGWIRKRSARARGIRLGPRGPRAGWGMGGSRGREQSRSTLQTSGADMVAAGDLAPPRSGIPILGRIAAGGPVLAPEHVEGCLDAERIARGGSDFALRVTGESMRDAGILPGDIVLVRQDPEPRNGEIVVAMIGDETTVKRFERQRGEIRLVPENPEFAPLIVTASSPTLRILGRVVGVYREFA